MPIHIAITRRVKPGLEAVFQQALREFFQSSFEHGGVLGVTMIVPPPGSDSREFGILRTFADERERDEVEDPRGHRGQIRDRDTQQEDRRSETGGRRCRAEKKAPDS